VKGGGFLFGEFTSNCHGFKSLRGNYRYLYENKEF